MATTLSTRQGLLTKALNRLNSALEANKGWAQAILQPPLDEHERRIYMRTERAKIRKVKAILESETLSVDDALGRYSSAADSLAADTPSLEEILKRVNSNVETAATVLDYGQTMLTSLKHRLEEPDGMETPTSFSEAPQTNLLPIPIPKFSGRIWEWDTFWGTFNHSVDSREMDNLYKMNYLLDALQGEAKETVKQFELQLKGENVDNCFLQDQLLGKFTEGIQRHVLRAKEQRSPNDNWDTNMLLSCAKEYIRTELKIVTRVGKGREQQAVQEPAGDRRYPRTGRKISSAPERRHSCFYCGQGDHAAKDCTEVATREERMSFMRKRNLCLNCGSAEHWAVQCKGGACRICNNHGHHTSLCQQLPSATKIRAAAHESKKPHQTSNRATSKRITVTKIGTVTEPILRRSLSEEDRRFLSDNNIRLSINSDIMELNPQVLLGCADLYTFLEGGFARQKTLPSGLTLIPSKLRYLVSRYEAPPETNFTEQPHSDAEVKTSTTGLIEDVEDTQTWEQFCTFESTGVHEFTGPSVEERKNLDAQFWKTFGQTIEKRQDGCYVGLPWKDNAEALSDNKGLAIRRLQATLAKLAKDPLILQQYHDTIANQHEQGIIEEVDEDSLTEGSVVHYLVHHAVLTPQKETTKLRVVFDAPAHLKGEPSLNDVLHPGPVILPKICDILLRFRLGRFAIVSDVEKAFLQVHLLCEDRDATRFIWLRDINQPLTPGNTVIYRLTRVTFGLNCSPFLLAGTIKHHLDACSVNSKLAREVASNTYVDNIIVTTSSEDEALQFYTDSKHLFNDLLMNLREFRSNDETLNAPALETRLRLGHPAVSRTPARMAEHCGRSRWL
uniref:CCHC-type domain-containing protein n=1 Tax=Haemonchus contortus TaxID=6289 RepID=A0A7I5EBZ3_HAECO